MINFYMIFKQLPLLDVIVRPVRILIPSQLSRLTGFVMWGQHMGMLACTNSLHSCRLGSRCQYSRLSAQEDPLMLWSP